ncbi:hypothetical protein MYCTH_77895 [Thermothelomyces thermophilus ATCC 42464]|uniref:Coenzyme Q-binding protein COQ10 START domain-containing protein n=1 Tax=Thermothelomyces thermophilus (strain ATCC 42464 / BCRC 31852 / DSM 1799) TaxID=573729 RepID=G2Q6G4_THET4|nr:uncharacterized protein MYCTH_77895 [Thermothelomyces thermophilus ATCC 42464]AEO54736.1 hypothetical protein MYCTH_77895 [Thermothelomyces thermophilus ATCC 42464]
MSDEPSSHAVTGPPIPTITYGSGGSFSVSCSSRIAATPKECLDVVTAASEYPAWNRFCRKCTIDAQPPAAAAAAATAARNSDDGPCPDTFLRLGTQFTFDVHLDPEGPDGKPGRPTALEVSVLEPIDEEEDPGDGSGGRRRRRGWRIAWKQRHGLLMPAAMLRSERVQEFVEVAGDGDGRPPGTQYYCWETFYGPLAPVVRLIVGRQVERGFDAWLRGLKARVEMTGQGQGQGQGQGRGGCLKEGKRTDR